MFGDRLTSFKCQFIRQVVTALDGALPRYLGVTAWGAYLVKSSRNLNTPKAEVGIGLMMPAHHSSRCDFHFWILLLLLIASPQGTVLKIQVQSCWKRRVRILATFLVSFAGAHVFP